MGEELEATVATQVVLHTAVDGFALACWEVFETEGEGLLILLEALAPLRIDGARDPWREGVAHGRAVGVLLYIDRSDGEACGRTG